MRGKSAIGVTPEDWRISFNEARALCAGSLDSSNHRQTPSTRFNEARALCAGSPAARSPPGCSVARFNEARALCAGSP